MLGCPLLLFKANTQCTVEHMSLAFHVISLRSERARAVSQPTHSHCPSLPGHIRSTPLIIHYDSRSTIIMSHLQIDACGHEHRGLKDAARDQHVVRQMRAVFGALFAPRIPARASCYQCRPWPLVSLAQIDGWPSGRASRQSVGDDQTPLCHYDFVCRRDRNNGKRSAQPAYMQWCLRAFAAAQLFAASMCWSPSAMPARATG